MPILFPCGDTARNPARSGIQTVVRSLLATFGATGEPVRPVVWRPASRHFHPLPAGWSLGLGAEPLRDPPTRLRAFARHPAAWPSLVLAGGRAEHVPVHRHPRHRHAPPGTWVLLAELLYGHDRAEGMIDYVRRRGWRLAVILYDTIPVDHPEFVPPDLPAKHAEYLRVLSRADLILPISEATAQGWRAFTAREGLPSPPVQACPLACDLPGTPRVRAVPAPSAANAPIRMLCVSTLEPRKNHRSLFAAFALATARRPDLNLQLDLVGASYVGAQDLAAQAQALIAAHPGQVRWHPRLEHAALQQLYAGCDFTVYPSVLEGFGLPVIESLWFARPCLCACFGVMAENAADGGCLTCDVREPRALADAILQLADDPALRAQLAQQAVTRPLKTWREYAQEILSALAKHS